MHDEAALLQAFQSDDPNTALERLFETYADPLYRLAMSVCGDPAAAEDIVQETFLSALVHRQQFQGRSKLGTWLYRIAYNACHDRLRKKAEDPLPEEEADEDGVQMPFPQALMEWRWAPEDMLSDREARRELEKAIHDLPENLRVVFLLRDIEELSTEETAEALGIRSGAVKVRLHRARMALRESLAEYFEDRYRGKEHVVE